MQSGNAAMTLDQPLRFVLHGHFASHHHFDFRLERDGVLKSWAVPKELPEKSGERRLAIMVESNRENRLPGSPLIRTVRATFTAHGSSTPDIGRQQGVPICGTLHLGNQNFSETFARIMYEMNSYTPLKKNEKQDGPDRIRTGDLRRVRATS